MNRRFIVFLVLVAVIASIVGLVHPVAVHADCIIADLYNGANSIHALGGIFALQGETISISNTATLDAQNPAVTGVTAAIDLNGRNLASNTGTNQAATSVQAPTTGFYVARFSNGIVNGSVTMNVVVRVSQQADCSGSTIPSDSSSSAGVSGFRQLTFTDGRMNSHDGGETAAVYCNTDDGVDVWSVVDSVGYFAFTVTKADLSKVPAKPLKNTLIKTGLGVSLYRLTTGELQINSTNNYVFIWNGCPAA